MSNMGMNELGALLRSTRERRGLRAYDLSYAIGQNPSWLSRIEGGDLTHPPAPNVMEALSKELGLSQSEMLNAIGYDVGKSSVDSTEDDPVRMNLVAKVLTVRLTDERTNGLERLLDLWRDLDLRAEQRVEQDARANR